MVCSFLSVSPESLFHTDGCTGQQNDTVEDEDANEIWSILICSSDWSLLQINCLLSHVWYSGEVPWLTVAGVRVDDLLLRLCLYITQAWKNSNCEDDFFKICNIYV